MIQVYPNLQDVEEASTLQSRLYRTIRETMRAMAGRISGVTNWEARKLLARHIWLDAEHANAIRQRVLELRYPRVDVDLDGDKALLPPNFSPVYALAFCAGVFLPGRLAWWLPMCLLFITDAMLNVHYGVPVLGSYLALNYVAYAVLIGLGRRFSARRSWLHLLGGGLLGAIVFYLITNTAAWLNPAPGPFAQTPYPKTLLGWVQALTIGASPWPPTWTFFRDSLLSGGLFMGLFVSAISSLSSSQSAGAETADGTSGEPLTPEPEPS